MLLVDCGATSHIITDETKFVSIDESFQPEKHFIELADGKRFNNLALKRGDVMLSLIDLYKRRVKATSKIALYIPLFPQNIFSMQAATKEVQLWHSIPMPQK